MQRGPTSGSCKGPLFFSFGQINMKFLLTWQVGVCRYIKTNGLERGSVPSFSLSQHKIKGCDNTG